MVSTSQKISCRLARINSFFENFPPNSNASFQQQKISSDQKPLFPLDRKFVSTSRVRDLFKKCISTIRKVASSLKNLKIAENIEKTGVRETGRINNLFCSYFDLLYLILFILTFWLANLYQQIVLEILITLVHFLQDIL